MTGICSRVPLGTPIFRRFNASCDAANALLLLRELAAQLPEEELEPLGEIVRSSLTGLALWWLDNPDVPRATVLAAMLRMTTGMLSTLARGGSLPLAELRR
jgi:hypothetical protein